MSRSEGILRELLPRYVDGPGLSRPARNGGGEHAARMTAMAAATENARDLIDLLTLLYNKTRQAAITKEILEVVSARRR